MPTRTPLFTAVVALAFGATTTPALAQEDIADFDLASTLPTDAEEADTSTATTVDGAEESPATEGSADIIIGGDIHLLQGENGSTVVTAEYFWQAGDFGGFGFIDKNLDGSGYFTNHEIRANIEGPVYALVEIGGSPAGDFQLAGVGVRLGGLPIVEDGFVFLNVTAEVANGANASQMKIVWRTKNLGIAEDVSIYSSGFVRIRESAPNVAQPQLWLHMDDLPVEFGTEIGIFGDGVNVQAAVKINL